MRKRIEEIICKVKQFIMVDEVERKYKNVAGNFFRNRKLPRWRQLVAGDSSQE